MNFRLIITVIVSIAAVSAIFAITRFASSSSAFKAPFTALPTDPASYLGVYEKGPPDTYRPVKNFAKAINRQPNLVGYYSGWREPFKASFAKTVHEHGAATIVQMDPTHISMSAIADGYYDTYLRSFAHVTWVGIGGYYYRSYETFAGCYQVRRRGQHRLAVIRMMYMNTYDRYGVHVGRHSLCRDGQGYLHGVKTV